jgi:hypothetical protein
MSFSPQPRNRLKRARPPGNAPNRNRKPSGRDSKSRSKLIWRRWVNRLSSNRPHSVKLPPFKSRLGATLPTSSMRKRQKMATAKRADVEAAVKQMKADAAEAEARMQKFKQAGGESWTALSAAWLSHERPSIEPVSRDGMHSRAPQGRRPERLRPAPFLAKFDIPKSYRLRQQNRRFISALGEQAYVFEPSRTLRSRVLLNALQAELTRHAVAELTCLPDPSETILSNQSEPICAQ